MQSTCAGGWLAEEESDGVDLPELTSIQMGERAFTFNVQEPHNELVLRSDSSRAALMTRFAQTHYPHIRGVEYLLLSLRSYDYCGEYLFTP